jgi:hypothetical protein
VRRLTAGVVMDDAYVAEDDWKAPGCDVGGSGLSWTSQEGPRTRLAMAWPSYYKWAEERCGCQASVAPQPRRCSW